MANLPQRLSSIAAAAAAAGTAAAVETGPAAAAGDRLRALVDGELDRAARIIRSLGAPPDELEDLVQQAFSITAERLREIAPGKERAFLVETAVRLTAAARRRRALGREAAADPLPDVADPAPTPEDLSDQRRALALLDRVLYQMDEDLRTVLVLFEVEQMTTAEIAAALRIPPGTTASRLRRAREDFNARVRRMAAGAAPKGGRP